MRKALTLLVTAFGVALIGSPTPGGARPAAVALPQVSAPTVTVRSAGPAIDCLIPATCQVIGAIACKRGPCPTLTGARTAATTPRRSASGGAVVAPSSPRFTCEGLPSLVCQALYAATAPVCRKYGCDSSSGTSVTVASPAVHDPLSALCTVQTGRIPNPFCLLPSHH